MSTVHCSWRVFPALLSVVCLSLFSLTGWAATAAGSENRELTELTLLDAVSMALAQQPDIYLAQEAAAYQKGVYTQSGGEFDLTGEAALEYEKLRESVGTQDLYGWTAVEQKQETESGTLGLHRKLRTGQTLSVEVSGSQVNGLVHGIHVNGPDNVGQVSFTVVQPLAKGRGREATDANEESARRESEAAAQEVFFVVSQKVAEAARAYWAYLASIRGLEILREAESRSLTVVEQISTLIAKEELPAVELDQAQANLADARRTRLEGEQTVFESRQKLLLAMGMDGSRLSSNVVCRDDFPAVPNTKALGSLELEALVRLAMSLRSDYRAQEWVESAREAFLNGVKGKMAPQVDLRLKAAYAGYKDGAGPDPFFRSFGDNVPGASVSVQIQALWPFSNSTMRGILTQAKSQLEQARWEKEKLTRQIRSDLMVAWSQLKNKIAVLEEARLAGEKYRTSLSSERKKYLLGMSTLVNVLTVENQLTRAQLNLVVAQTEVATALVALRYQTGTILFQEGEKTTVHADDLIRLPSTQMQAQNRPGGPPPPGKGPHAW